MIKAKKLDDLLLSITKNSDTPIEQTKSKTQETLEFKMTKPKETFHFNPPIQIKGDWMIGLIDLEVYSSNFITTEENNELELYTDTIHEFFFEVLEDELEEIPKISDITAYHLQHETIGPQFIEA